ncbi:MAG: phenylacetic acid degradation operon negative regulatory protein [Hyphomicrobiaceae bacterium]|jgi:phenylacetic acid degradation operon negative regulatory protein
MFATLSPTPKRLILDLVATAREGSMPVRALVAAADLFSIEEGSLRVALARLCHRELIEADGRGRYRLGAAARPVGQRVGSWRRAPNHSKEWSGSWLAVSPSVPNARRSESQRATRALAFLGFARFGPGLHVRPDNLAGGADAARETLRGLGLPPSSLVCRADQFDVASDTRARALWDTSKLEDGYRDACLRLAASTARLQNATLEEALVESYSLGGEILREILFDPTLPAPLVDVHARTAMVDAMVAYDRIGRALWSRFMRPYGIATVASPVAARAEQDATPL